MEENIKKTEDKKEEVKPVEVPKINYDTWKKVEIKVGKILTVDRIEKSEKLLKLSVDFAEASGPRQIVSGIAKYFPDITVLVNKKCAFVTNLEPKPLMGLESNGMILAVGGGDEPFSIFEVNNDVLVGTQAK
jgi:methionyl-tRNA synthetase